MIRVILNTPDGRKVDLLPENITVREAVAQFRTDCPMKGLCVDGEVLKDNDLDRELLEFSENDEARISLVPEPAESAENPEDEAVLTGAEARAYMVLSAAKDMMDEEMRSLMEHTTPFDEDEPPF